MKKLSQNILNYTLTSLDKHGITVITEKSKVCKRLRLIYMIVAAYSVLMMIFYLGGQWVYCRNAADSAARLSEFVPKALFFGGCIVVFLAGMFFSAKRYDFFAAPLTLVSAVAAAIGFAKNMYNVDMIAGLHPDWWWRHGLPLILSAVFAALLFFFRLSGARVIRQAYDNMVSRLYKQNLAEESMSDAEWQAFLDGYDPHKEEGNRRRRKKGLAEYNGILDSQEENLPKEE